VRHGYRRNVWRDRTQAVYAGRRAMVRSVRAALARAGCNCRPNLSGLSDTELKHAAVTDGKTVLHRAGCRLLTAPTD
jgi:hypothetical protein